MTSNAMQQVSQNTNYKPLPPLEELPFHPDVERLAKIISVKTNNKDLQFFRIAASYYMGVMAANQHAIVVTPDNRKIPCNVYAIGLATSGSGKGFITSTFETKILSGFEEEFTQRTLQICAENNFSQIALKRAAKKGTDPDDELERVQKDWERLGELPFCFSSATSAAIQQARFRIQFAKAGAFSMQMDELGDNLSKNSEVLPLFLELYDVGFTRGKLTKNTDENTRLESIGGMTPTNLLMFGTPSKLFNGSRTEDEFFAFLEAGFARRSFFAYVMKHRHEIERDVDALLNKLMQSQDDAFLDELRDRYALLADYTHIHKQIKMELPVFRQFLEYQILCQERAAKLPEHAELQRAEFMHRHFKTLKMAGVYAFVDQSPVVEEKHLHYAIRLAEESGKAFDHIVNRDRPHVRLAKYLAGIPEHAAVTHADIVEDLNFYPASAAKRNEMLQLAIAYGYRNNIIIKKSYDQGIEFLHGETLEETDLSKMIVSYSTDIADGYQAAEAPWEKLYRMTQTAGLHWISHHTDNGHRSEDHIVPGCNMVVFDIDGTTTLDNARTLLKDYTYLIYTTKRHGQDRKDRFRLIMPINYVLEMNKDDYTTMMKAIAEWLPFEVDNQTFQRSRKWLSHPGHYEYNEGKILDVLPFIPRTERDEERKRKLAEFGSNLDALERWVLYNTGSGNRNNMLLRYAMVLVDTGHNFEQVRQKVLELNDKMPDKLTEQEISATILVTVARKLSNNKP